MHGNTKKNLTCSHFLEVHWPDLSNSAVCVQKWQQVSIDTVFSLLASLLLLLLLLLLLFKTGDLHIKCKGKSKSVPLQAWTGPEGSKKLRFPAFVTAAQDGGKVVSLTYRPPLPPGKIPGTHFC